MELVRARLDVVEVRLVGRDHQFGVMVVLGGLDVGLGPCDLGPPQSRSANGSNFGCVRHHVVCSEACGELVCHFGLLEDHVLDQDCVRALKSSSEVVDEGAKAVNFWPSGPAFPGAPGPRILEKSGHSGPAVMTTRVMSVWSRSATALGSSLVKSPLRCAMG